MRGRTKSEKLIEHRFGAHLQPLREFFTFDDLEAGTLQALYRALDQGNVVGLVGTGMSYDFNYPLWGELAQQVVQNIKSNVKFRAGLNDIERTYVDNALEHWIQNTDSPSLLTGVLDYCHRLYFRRHVSTTEFSKVVQKAIKIYAGKAKEANRDNSKAPIRSVIRDLGIRRFVTTNYDNVLQQVLTDNGDINAAPALDRRDPRVSKLITFAMALGEYRNGIVRLHGSLDDPANGLVLTEAQYQRQYTSDDFAARAAREALRQIYLSNAILFVGFSMRDDDVLRPFRQFVSDHNIAARHRPWFALIDMSEADRKKGQDLETYHRLYYRYGIRSIFAYYEKPSKIGRAVKDKIEEIRRGWLEYRESRESVPVARKPEFSISEIANRGDRAAGAGKLCIQHEPEYLDDITTKNLRFDPATRTIVDGAGATALGPPGRYGHILVGPAGSSRGSTGYFVARNTLDGATTSGEPPIRFYATTHFANDFLSQLDGAYNHLTQGLERDPRDANETPVRRFFDALRNRENDCVIVFGGIERLLRLDPYRQIAPWEKQGEAANVDGQAHWSAPIGRSLNSEVHEFFLEMVRFAQEVRPKQEAGPKEEAGAKEQVGPKKEMDDPLRASERFQKHVFLTSSMIPEPFAAHLVKAGVEPSNPAITLVALPVETRAEPDVRGVPTAVARVWRRHRFVADALGQAKRIFGDEWKRWLEDTELEIGRLNEREHADHIIRSLVDRQSAKDKSKPGLLRPVLEALSLFTTPVPASILFEALKVVAPDLKASWQDVKGLEAWAEKVSSDARLILMIKGREYPRFTAHSLLRQAMLARLGGRLVRPPEIHRFDIHDFVSEPDDVQPLRGETIDTTLRMFDGVADAYLRVSARAAGRTSAGAAPERKGDGREYIRGATAVLRSSWSATGLGRLLADGVTQKTPVPIYQNYHRRLARLLNLVYDQCGISMKKSAAPDVPADASAAADKLQEHSDASLYRDELAWLLNEIGLVCYCEGALLDGLAFLRLSRRVAEQIEGARPSYRMMESNINIAMILIDRARLDQARELLLQAGVLARGLPRGPNEMLARVTGLLGLVAHLAGDRDAAQSFYGEAIATLAKAESWRGVSVFRRHRGDLNRSLGDLRGARIDIDAAIAAAEAGFHPDLIHFCRLSEANLRRYEGRTDPGKRVSVTEIEPTLRFAKNLGSAKLESDAYRIKAFIELDQGDYESASQSAFECLWLSRAYQLRLRMISSIELLGQIFRHRGSLDDARHLFEESSRLARRYEYQAGMDATERALAELGAGAVSS